MNSIVKPDKNIKINEEHKKLIIRLIQWRENCKKEIEGHADWFTKTETRNNEKA